VSLNQLFFGDNLTVLRDHVKDGSVDLIYLDPPFNSQANYNVLFEERSGEAAEAQVEAFRDTWKWGPSAAEAYDDVMKAAGDLAIILKGLRSWLGQNAMMAYLAMMAVRLLELRRVLKPTGSLYLHCDPKASHYLKIILDAVFGHGSFRNEVIWKRTSGHSDARRYGSVHDTILFYVGGDLGTWNELYQPYDEEYVKQYYRYADPDGRKFMSGDLGAAGLQGGGYDYLWKGVRRVWRVPEETMQRLDREGRIFYTRNGIPRIKRYLDEAKGLPCQDVWDDIEALRSWHQERLGYPTQKPVALLERIMAASTKEGDVVLDPFCGCGTTVEAAERMKRQWLGIDVTHYAVTLIEARLNAKYANAKYKVHGRPVDLAGARDLARRDKYQFQWWAAWRLGAQTYREEKRGADRGIDGNIFFKNGPYGDGRIIISVKGGENVGVQMVRDLRGVIEREEAEMGILVCLAEPTKPMLDEASNAGFVRKSAHGRLPRLQVVTISDVLEGRMPKLPPLPLPEKHPVRAPRRKDRDQMELLLPFPGEKIEAKKGAIVDPRFVRLG
jgi:site-specific DNA-methyltransferase (adenine-specific)